jgi:rhamnogalacturonyl hydrolase YesR
MKYFKIYIILFTLLLFSNRNLSAQIDSVWIDNQLDKVVLQYSFFADSLAKINSNYTLFPRSIWKDNSNISLIGTTRMELGNRWTSGFLVGSLWLLYEFTNDDYWKIEALKYCETLLTNYISATDAIINCDYGFVYYTSLLPAYKYTNDVRYKNKLLEAADALSSLFNANVGATDSWVFDSEFKVIIDNMMSMDLLFWATSQTGDSSYYNIAVTHANTMIANQYRIDFSSFRAVYDPLTGNVLYNNSNSPVWSREQSWGLNAFTFHYKTTHSSQFLDQANGIADYWINNPNLPTDKVPYYHISEPITGQYRDASTTAIFADGLLELGFLANGDNQYIEFAEQSILTLSSDEYFTNLYENNGFLIKHASTATNEYDGSLIFADYYYIRSLMKLRDIYRTKKIDASIFLEGAYNTNTGEMNSNLSNYIDTESPYKQDIRIVSSIPENVVDWVLVELRDQITPSIIRASRSAFLLNSGKITDINGASQIGFNVISGNYFLSVKHRNHLPIMSSAIITLD